jgi:hypothetical protein
VASANARRTGTLVQTSPRGRRRQRTIDLATGAAGGVPRSGGGRARRAPPETWAAVVTKSVLVPMGWMVETRMP